MSPDAMDVDQVPVTRRMGDDEWEHVLYFLGMGELCGVARVNKQWARISEPLLRRIYLALHFDYRNPIPRGRWNEKLVVIERDDDDEAEPCWRHLCKAHQVTERAWRRGSYTRSGVALPRISQAVFQVDHVLERILLHHVEMVDPPPNKTTIVEIDKKTLARRDYPPPMWGGKGRYLRNSPAGQYSLEPAGERLAVVLRTGVFSYFGLQAQPVPGAGGEFEQLLTPIPAETEMNDEDIHDTRLYRDVGPNGRPTLTLGTLGVKCVRLYPMHDLDNDNVQIVPFPSEQRRYLGEQVESGMAVFTFNETHVFICTLPVVLIFERRTGALLCRLDIQSDHERSFSYPVAVRYEFPAQPPAPRQYRVSAPPMLLEPKINEGAYDLDPHAADTNIFEGTPCVFFDGDYLSIRGDPPLQSGSMPILIMPDYKRVLSELPNVPFDERGAYLRARMVIVTYWNRWVAANGGLIRGNRLLLSCHVEETSGGRSARDSLFVFNLKDLPTVPLQGRPSVPSLVPVMVDRGVAYPVEEGENAPPRGQWLTRDVEMDPTAIYRIMVKSMPTHGTLNYREYQLEALRFDGAVTQPS